MDIVKELVVAMTRDAAALQEICSALADANVNVLGFGLDARGGTTLMRFIPDSPRRAAEALRKSGLYVLENDVIAVGLPHEEGSFLTLSKAFAKSGQAILYCYSLIGLVSRPEGEVAVVLVQCGSPESAARALGEMGLPVLTPALVGQEA